MAVWVILQTPRCGAFGDAYTRSRQLALGDACNSAGHGSQKLSFSGYAVCRVRATSWFLRALLPAAACRVEVCIYESTKPRCSCACSRVTVGRRGRAALVGFALPCGRQDAAALTCLPLLESSFPRGSWLLWFLDVASGWGVELHFFRHAPSVLMLVQTACGRFQAVFALRTDRNACGAPSAR